MIRPLFPARSRWPIGAAPRPRARLGLPQEAKLIGLAGALARSRDIETLFRAADILAARDAYIQLAVADPRDDGLALPMLLVRDSG